MELRGQKEIKNVLQVDLKTKLKRSLDMLE